ncbi:MAG: sulfotransferase [Vicinamibacterales bacterium]
MSTPGPLIFLLGLQRSGTTWLHLQLARTGCFRFVTAADLCAGSTVTATDRGIDTIPAGPDTPEEYGLVINPGRLRFEEPDTTETTLPALRALCDRKARGADAGRPLLLKSPPDYPAGVPWLRAAFPSARFVAIQRHPLRTLDSQLRAWRQMVLTRLPYLAQIDRAYCAFMDDEPRRLRMGLFLHSPAGVAWLADHILRAHEGFMALQDDWHDDNLLVVRYEDLCRDQQAGFERLARFLDVCLPAPADAPAPRLDPVGAEAQAAFDSRRAAFRPFLQRYGYEEDAV